MIDDKFLKTLRSQAWERAKGELQSMLQTYWADDMDSINTLIKEFIKNVEDEGLQN